MNRIDNLVQPDGSVESINSEESVKWVYFELADGQRRCGKCKNNTNNVIRNMFNKYVSLWNFALLMSTRSSVDCLEELRVAGFTERVLELKNSAY